MDMFKKQPSKVLSRLVSVIPAALVLSLLPSAVLAADVYASAAIDDQGQLHIRIMGGREILPERQGDQVGFSEPQISEDGRVVGWRADFPNCCTSYPIPLKLVIYTNGRTRTFTGSGLPIWRWAFQAGGMRVAFEQETVHGGLGIHYELRDVATGRLIAKYDPKVVPDNQPLPVQNVPQWVRELDVRR